MPGKQSMFYHHDINGAGLPVGSLSLTYDDGPGKDTVALARFLHEEGIRATFFVVGQHVLQFPHVLDAVSDYGHLIGNHTFSHPGLVDLVAAGEDPVAEVAKTDRLIRSYAGETIYFRPPYGSWRPEDDDRTELTSAAAIILNSSSRFADYLGPIMWDITGGDWGFWERGEPVHNCLASYVEEIERVQRGIVLMHDSSETPAFAARNHTFELTRQLVPELRRRGFRFVGLDAIPDVIQLAEAILN